MGEFPFIYDVTATFRSEHSEFLQAEILVVGMRELTHDLKKIQRAVESRYNVEITEIDGVNIELNIF